MTKSFLISGSSNQLRNNTNSGFTLIELLVVIAIVSLISSVVLSSMSDARQSALDANRVQQLDNIRAALAQFYNQHGVYPCAPIGIPPQFRQDSYYTYSDRSWDHTNSSGDFLDFSTNGFTCDGGPNHGLVTEGFMQPLQDPGDPGDYEDAYYYEVIAANDPSGSGLQSYILYTYLESSDSKMQSDGGLKSCAYEVGSGLGDINPYWLSC